MCVLERKRMCLCVSSSSYNILQLEVTYGSLDHSSEIYSVTTLIGKDNVCLITDV